MHSKRIGLGLGLLLLVGIGYMMWPFIVGGGQMEAFCNSLKSGATIDGVKKAVQIVAIALRSGRNLRASYMTRGLSDDSFVKCILKVGI